MSKCLQDAQYKMAEKLRSSAVMFAANLRLAQATIMAIDNANQLISNYRKQHNIASEALDMMEENRRHMRTTFWVRELEFMSEYCSPEELETIEAVGRRYAGRLVATVARQFAEQLGRLRCNANKYCTSAFSRSLQDLSMARAQGIANARILGRLIAFKEIQQFDDLAFERKLQAAGLGQDLIGHAANFMEKGVTGYAQIGRDLAGRLGDNFTQMGMAVRQRGHDPGRSATMQAMLDGHLGQISYTPEGFSNQVADNTPDMDFRIDSSRIGGFRDAPGKTVTSWPHEQDQMQMNNGRVGNWDLARVGEKTYPVEGGDGTVTVKMSDFELDYVDHKSKGDT